MTFLKLRALFCYFDGEEEITYKTENTNTIACVLVNQKDFSIPNLSPITSGITKQVKIV